MMAPPIATRAHRPPAARRSSRPRTRVEQLADFVCSARFQHISEPAREQITLHAATLQAFFDELTDEQKASIRAVPSDISAGYEKAIRASVPDAQVCFDPLHVVQLGAEATDQVRHAEYNRHGRSSTGEGKWIKGVSYSLRKDPANQTTKQLARLAEVQQTNKCMFRAFLLLDELRYIYRLPKHEAADRLEAWPACASRSKLKPLVKLARTIRKHKQGVLSAIYLGLTNGRLEAEQPRPPDLTPRPRLPLSRCPDRDDLPLLRQHPHRPPSPMTTPKPTGEPYLHLSHENSWRILREV